MDAEEVMRKARNEVRLWAGLSLGMFGVCVVLAILGLTGVIR